VPSELATVPIVDRVEALIAGRDRIGHSQDKDAARGGGALQPA
jgi:hypothetical protein